MSLVQDFTYQLGASGTILNTDNALPFIDVTQVTGLDAAPIRTSIRDRDGHEGGWVDSIFEQARTVTITGTLYADSLAVELVLDQLKMEWAPSQVPVPLYVRHPGVGNRLLWVYPQGCRYSVDALRRLGMTECTFNAVAGDPRIYSETEVVRTIALTSTIQTGASFNMAFNMGFGGVTAGSYPPLVGNNGNRSTPVKFRMYGPYINPHVYNYTTGDEMAFNLLIDTTTDYLEVDTDARTVRLYNTWGVTNVRDKLRRPSWFDLQPGNNVIGFSVEGGAAGATHMDIIYRSAWR